MSAARKLSSEMIEIFERIDKRWHTDVEVVDLDQIQDQGADYSKVIGVSSQMDSTTLLDMILQSNLGHICQTNNSGFDRELNVAALMITDPNSFLSWPIASIIDPQNVDESRERKLKIFDRPFSKAREKSNVLDELVDCLEGVTKSQSLISDLRGVADELYTNAVFNAPFVNPTNHSNPGIDRNDLSIEITNGAEARLFTGISDDHLILGCQDPFGSLSVKKLLRRIRECYDRGLADTMNMGSGGAGIGSFMVYNASVSYYVAVVKGQSTTVCCSVPYKMSSRKRSQLPKNLHFFER